MRRRSEHGNVAIEFAFLLPVFMMIIFGTIEFGFALYNQEVITNASREAARFGIIQDVPKPTEGEIQTVVNDYMTGTMYDPGAATVTVTGAGGTFGNDLTVNIVYPYNFIVLPGFVQGLTGSIPLTATTTMKHE